MANRKSTPIKHSAGDDGAAGRVDIIPPGGSANTRVEVLNLAAMRAARSRQRPVIVDQYNVEHDLAGLTLDAYLALLEVEQEFGDLQDEENAGKLNRQRQVALIHQMRDTITAVLPEFPAGELFLDELNMVVQAIQRAIMPSGIREVEGDAEPGK